MITDAELKLKGFNILTETLGEVIAEKFITLIIKDKFDYTKWQKSLLLDVDLETLSKNAMKDQTQLNK